MSCIILSDMSRHRETIRTTQAREGGGGMGGLQRIDYCRIDDNNGWPSRLHCKQLSSCGIQLPHLTDLPINKVTAVSH